MPAIKNIVVVFTDGTNPVEFDDSAGLLFYESNEQEHHVSQITPDLHGINHFFSRDTVKQVEIVESGLTPTSE